MITNCNLKTGIPYGVYDARDAMDLFEAIQDSGVNLWQADAMAEWPREINAYLEFDDLDSEMRDGFELSDDPRDGNEAEQRETYAESFGLYKSFEQLNDREQQRFWDGWIPDEAPYTATIGGMDLILSWLGGAPLIIVTDSPIIVTGSWCSPCIPGGVNVDSVGEIKCYGILPNWLD